jgi:E3 ubiquitin-protein ligase SspH2
MMAQAALKKPCSKENAAVPQSVPKKAFLAQAEAWANQPVVNLEERRDIALQRIKDVLDPLYSILITDTLRNRGREFNFSGCHLTSLPEIPNCVGDIADQKPTLGLDLSYNQLTRLPDLSGLTSLTTLNLYGNRLHSLPDLSTMSALTTLNLGANQFTDIPSAHLPKNLRTLILSKNRLTALPDLSGMNKLNRLELVNNQLDILPDLSTLRNLQELDLSANRFTDSDAIETLHKLRNLKTLRLRDNRLPALPDISGLSELTSLDLSVNRLTSLSGMHLPRSLQSLILSDNLLTTLTDIARMSELERLELSNNQLRIAPDVSSMKNLQILDISQNLLLVPPDLSHMQQLQEIVLSNNQCTHIPEEWLSFPWYTEIHLENNPISQRILEQMYERANAADYQGPTFFFSMSINNMAARPIDQAVAEWYADLAQTSHTDWSSIAHEPHADNFSILLDRLRTTINFTLPEFKQEVIDWLARIHNDAELRKEIFLIAEEGLGSCEDRVSLAFNTMKKRELELKTARGDYDNDLPALIAIARQQFRLDELEKLAYQKSKTLTMVDEIEINLAYQVKLCDVLQLDLPSQQMRFFEVSGVTEHDLDIAQTQIQDNEAQNFTAYLAEWSPWQAVLQRLAPAAYQQVAEQRSELASSEFEVRLHQLLQQHHLDNTEFNRAQYKDQVLQDISHDTFQQLTQQFLQQRKLSHLLTHSTARSPAQAQRLPNIGQARRTDTDRAGALTSAQGPSTTAPTRRPAHVTPLLWRGGASSSSHLGGTILSGRFHISPSATGARRAERPRAGTPQANVASASPITRALSSPASSSSEPASTATAAQQVEPRSFIQRLFHRWRHRRHH